MDTLDVIFKEKEFELNNCQNCESFLHGELKIKFNSDIKKTYYDGLSSKFDYLKPYLFCYASVFSVVMDINRIIFNDIDSKDNILILGKKLVDVNEPTIFLNLFLNDNNQLSCKLVGDDIIYYSFTSNIKCNNNHFYLINGTEIDKEKAFDSVLYKLLEIICAQKGINIKNFNI